MARHRDINWNLPDRLITADQVTWALLMDIRDELKTIRGLLSCYRIPRAMEAVVRLDKRMAKTRKLSRRG
jgi:hypothetical protein